MQGSCACRIVQKGYVRFFGSLWAKASQGWRACRDARKRGVAFIRSVDRRSVGGIVPEECVVRDVYDETSVCFVVGFYAFVVVADWLQ